MYARVDSFDRFMLWSPLCLIFSNRAGCSLITEDARKAIMTPDRVLLRAGHRNPKSILQSLRNAEYIVISRDELAQVREEAVMAFIRDLNLLTEDNT